MTVSGLVLALYFHVTSPVPAAIEWACRATCQECGAAPNEGADQQENTARLLELRRSRATDAEARRTAEDVAEEAMVRSRVEAIPRLWEIVKEGTWEAAHGTEPGTYVGTAPEGTIETILGDHPSFTSRRARSTHKRRLGHDAVEFKESSEFVVQGRGNLRSLHVSVNPSGRYEVHVDRFNPHEGVVPFVLHVIVEWLPPRIFK